MASSSIIGLLDSTPGLMLAPLGCAEQPFVLGFLQFLGSGLHTNVWKVSTGSKVYVLNVAGRIIPRHDAAHLRFILLKPESPSSIFEGISGPRSRGTSN